MADETSALLHNQVADGQARVYTVNGSNNDVQNGGSELPANSSKSAGSLATIVRFQLFLP